MKNINNICKEVNIEEELKNSYLDYAMSVIISRALPDVRDGLKPVHRRILYAMNVLNNDFNKPYKKSARIVGDVIGKYHPHGDNSVYEAIVRMAQKFSLRYVLVDGQGNFGSIDGDSAAAMRYTEIRMSKISHELLLDLDKDTVDFYLNYDNSEYIPSILPSRIPNLLINGSYGIAVGVATNIPPHNLSEIINGCLAIIKNENISISDLMKYVPGPDFPTAAIIHGKSDIENIYKTGKGKICIKSKTKIETNKDGHKFIVIEEIPYQTNKIKIIEKISELVKLKKINGISNIKDESNQEGIRIIIDLKKDSSDEIILNNLYTNTPLQTYLHVNMVALCNNKPKLMSLKEILIEFIKHRENIINRRTLFSLKKYNEKIHILEGFIIAINNIDEIIDIIKNSYSIDDAKNNLLKINYNIKESFYKFKNKYEETILKINKEYIKNKNDKYNLTNIQIKSILDLKLHRLTSLEYESLLNEYEDIIKKIEHFIWILEDKKNLKEIICKELNEIKIKYKDKRLTEIIKDNLLIDNNLLIKNFKVVITLSYYGYIKYQPLSSYEAQKRGGKGKSSTKIKSEDFIISLLVSYTHDDILLFSNKGRIYRIKVHQLPESSRCSKGKPLSNLITIDKNERITAILSINLDKISDNNYIFMATSKGFVKKTNIRELIKSRNSGFIAIKLNNKDELVGVNITNGKNNIMLFSENGKVVRFMENKVRSTSRTSSGVKGITLSKSDKVVSLIIPNNNDQILTITNNGFGKRTNENEYPIKSRAIQGVISTKITEKGGKVIKSIKVSSNDQILIITDFGTLVRIRVSEIRISGRNTSGVKLIKISNNQNVVDLQRIINDI